MCRRRGCRGCRGAASRVPDLCCLSSLAEDSDAVAEGGENAVSGDEEELVFLGGDGEEEVCMRSGPCLCCGSSRPSLRAVRFALKDRSLVPRTRRTRTTTTSCKSLTASCQTRRGRDRTRCDGGRAAGLSVLIIEQPVLRGEGCAPAHRRRRPLGSTLHCSRRSARWTWPFRCTSRARRPLW